MLTINVVSIGGVVEGGTNDVSAPGLPDQGATHAVSSPGPAHGGTATRAPSPAYPGTTPNPPSPGGDTAGLLFGALADPTRRRVVELLGTRPWRAGELATATGTSSPAMSRHLRVLLRAGLVADERLGSDARARVFRLRPQSLAALHAWLDQLQAQWDEQLAAFKRYVDGRSEG
jgi:DNA-binding transcriptional ArsR family regulator